MSKLFPNKKIVVVLPAYNAEKTLKKTFDTIPKDYIDDIILVDDCSKDNTVSYSRSLGIKTFRHDINLGYGGNQKTCYREAIKLGADIVVMVHPDFQYNPVYIPDMIKPIAEGKAEAVFGSRMIIKGGARKGGMPLWKYIANITLTKIANLFLWLNLSEYHSGFRAYSKKALETMPIQTNSNNFVFDAQIIAQLKQFNLNIAEVPITTKYFPGASMIGFWKSVEYGISILLVLSLYILHNIGLRKYRILLPPVKSKCRICDSETAQLIYKESEDWNNSNNKFKSYRITDSIRSHGKILKCVKCDLIYVSVDSSPDVAKIYSEQVIDDEYIKEEFGRRKQYKKIVSFLKSIGSFGELVDIGSGPGFFLDEAKKAGFKVSGIESGKVWVNYAKEKLRLTQVSLGSFEDLTKYPDNYFSVITAWDVIEHVDSPKFFMELIHKKLKVGGIFALSTPIIDSLASRVLGERWHAVIPSHLTYFTRSTLLNNLKDVGFVVKRTKFYTRFFSLQYLFNRLFKKTKDSFMRKIVVPVSLFDEIELYVIKKH
ncbi:MAG: bifunctional glycosyltransferase/class I SAM-dependent methyltransferase [Minisyncoccia bacterium]